MVTHLPSSFSLKISVDSLNRFAGAEIPPYLCIVKTHENSFFIHKNWLLLVS